ncbi:alanine--tRNA ligase [Zongyangia hominis]|uniref:Alanine--tRNA ligase n=1 Tax=Zongyangia hominis TaxID=2763677 RepID=A0A926EA88_9FIRM|nr:alanine--tRNA ligase [Zongyangia hominis]MBC8570785.1 alanine--tRNA ligase [Zongyangia hominis]
MQWTGLNELREKFLTFFESKGHTRLPSFPLVPIDDKSLLLINSGMAPMKKWFLGQATPPSKRVTTCQKCIRTPDIERVGKTSRHGTYFEMLGNFSFGDYFKHEATKWAWEFITEVLELPVDRIWVSIYENDEETKDIWVNEVGVDPGRIVRLGKEDNFWEIGSGPCGPCSEIYFDRGEEFGCGSPTCGVGCDCDRFVEFWNLVFSQFNGDGNDHYTPLEHPNIDTGMGLERLACIMQGVDNLFEVDTVQNIMKHIRQIAGVEYGVDEKTDVSLRVITDHIRSTTFMIGDGVVPQNEGRGYVLRRLLRRAARHGKLLGIKGPFLYQVVDTVIQENETAYPELKQNSEYIKKVVRVEEERFSKTIDQGMELLSEMIDKLESNMEGAILSGEQAFKLYDTFGFPIDLTREIIAEKAIGLDEEGFVKLMEEQKRKAREAHFSKDTVGWKDDSLKDVDVEDEFVGYVQPKAQAKIVAIVKDGETADSITEGDEAVIVLDKTPFYAESGGQVGDTGAIVDGTSVFKVTDCKKSPSGQFMHIGKMESGCLAVNDKVNAAIDEKRRQAIMRNHSCCHLLQAALRDVLGDHVHQAGSYVDDERLRFDFSHFAAMTPEEIAAVEKEVNEKILAGLPICVKEMPIEEAKKMGAMALFGEKYGDTVRVVNMDGYSIEFCGGTHLDNTAKAGLFKIISESSVAAGVRRIEATTGLGVLHLLDDANQVIVKSAENLKLANPSDLVGRTHAVAAELKEKEKELEALSQKMAYGKAEELMKNAKEVCGVRVVGATFSNMKAETVRAMCDTIKEKFPNIVAVLATSSDGKGNICAACGKEAVKMGVHAGKLIKEVAQIAGGNGGGRPDSAMAGVKDIFKMDEAIAAVPAILEKMLGK